MHPTAHTTVIALLVALGGCVPVSHHPYFAEDDARLDPALIGEWIDTDDKSRWTIIQKEDRTLRIEERGRKGLQAVYLARCFPIEPGGPVLVDISLHEVPIDETAALWAHMIPGHTLSQLQAAADTLRLSMLDEEWLQERLEAGAIDTPHLEIGDRLVLTGSTAQLRPLALTLADSAVAFAVDVTLIRVRE